MSVSLGLGLSPCMVHGGAPLFDPLSLSPHIWLDPSDLSTLFQDAAMTTPVTADGDPVGAILDKSGNDLHPTQSTASSRPIYKTDGTVHWLEFDGVDDVLFVHFFLAGLALPHDRLVALRKLNTSDRRMLGQNLQLQMGSGSIRTGVNLEFSIGSSTVGTDFITTEHIAGTEGAESRGAIDNGDYLTGDADVPNPINRLEIGAFDDGNQAANIRFYGLVQFDYALTDGQIASLRTYLAAKQGRVL